MKRLERLFHVMVFIVQCGGIVPMLVRTGDDAADLGAANPANTISTGVILVVTLILLLRHGRGAIRLLPRIWPMAMLVLLAVASISWSDYPDVSLRRAGSLVTVALWAWYLAARYDLGEIVAIARDATGLLALASLAVGAALPAIGGEDPLGPAGWRGVFSTKNDLGLIMALGSITYFYSLCAGGWRKFGNLIRQLAGFLICLVVLDLAQSSTCLLITVLGLALCLVIKVTHKRVGVAIIIWATILLLLAPAVVIVTNQLDAIAPLVGRDAQLTGRVDLWLILPSYIAERPWFGYGLGGFWVADSANVALIWDAVGWAPPHAHDGWLDLLLELGAVGLTLLALQILLIVVNGIRAVVEGSDLHSQYLLVTTFVLLIYNISESNLVRPGVMWALLVIASTALARIARQRQPKVRRGLRFQPRGPLGSPSLGR
jgi:exopolysaccharide production protein ExoQ